MNYLHKLSDFPFERMFLHDNVDHVQHWSLVSERSKQRRHDQFFFNSTGIVWPDALKAFREIGHSEVVAIINTSVSRLPQPCVMNFSQYEYRRQTGNVRQIQH